MSRFELKLPKMGESVAEATITNWLKEVGDEIQFDEAVVEIATDKVDSEVPSEKKGILIERCFDVDDVVEVGQIIAIIETDETEDSIVEDNSTNNQNENLDETQNSSLEIVTEIEDSVTEIISEKETKINLETGFLSPLVKNIVKKENISTDELSNIKGSGKNNRITKSDILTFLSNRNVVVQKSLDSKINIPSYEKLEISDFSDEVIEMTKMGKLISNHMTESVKTSAHVQSFIEVDVTNIDNWRSRVKSGFESREGQKFTFTPIFIEAVAVALRQYPMMNISVNNDKIIIKKKINIGMATALSDGNLIVPVIKNADQLNLVGMAKTVNDLASRARNNGLKPDDIAGGTYTITNVGVFGSIMGTPIINQPQVGILAFGAIRKMPSVIETEEGDYIGIRKKMIISHSYDHRVVNGALGSKFIKAVKEYIENWNSNREI
ncbi:MAG: diapophytoene dehydrogenase [Flavobacteriaceae bacterium]|mgnify:FL=1|jgi:2-oxoglutarate dehydrogenase E2 component (dihydrolipoamide succinyltransferase)|nr:diapophytoene dehydrogenase [Flavobacteriaceae bacterium]|tara:strand:+ start:10215 stop:11528 length:1314 start_codon:yes stop_codon:yes gene_type:complete